jgi:adenylyltransferase/sulfurtransferase
VLPGLVGLVQASETIKLVAGIGEPLVGRLLTIDALEMRFEEFRLQKDPDCPACGKAARAGPLEEIAVQCEATTAEDVGYAEIAVGALAALQQAGAELLLVDVRQPDEFEIARIPGARLVPLPELEARLAELEGWRDRTIVVHCKSGGRSASACTLLVTHGFTRVANLRGGIDAWSLEVDPTLPRY